MAARRKWRDLDIGEKALCAGFVMVSLAITLLAVAVIAFVVAYVGGYRFAL